ncbi:MAG: alpha/beta hydrolase [Oceanospirillaceae bacterium]|nr:alpha/beta hydrolase [Oceanospirillaceae bacterium]MBT11130.1 alpha/beta hydrolase [Oceanospirillaceae bacterium]
MAGDVFMTHGEYPDSATEHYWRCRYGQLAGLSWGEPRNDQTIIALHGWLDNAASFGRIAPQLKGCHLVAPDLPGHGHSDWLGDGGDYLIWSGVEAIYDLINQLPLSRPPVILGHSMGSAAGLLFAGAFPQWCRGFIALDALGPLTTPASGAPAQLARAVRERRVRPADERKTYQSTEDALSARLRQTPGLSADAILPVAERNLQHTDDHCFWRTDPRLRDTSRMRLTEEQVAAFAGALNCPALAIRAQQGLIPESLIRSRSAYFPRIEYCELPGHHHFHLESATSAAVAEKIMGFIQGLS